MVKNEIEKKLESFEKRIKDLEKVVFDKKKGKLSPNKYEGLSGGINYLIDNHFFNTLRSKKEVYMELKKEGYYHRPQAVDTLLRRDFVTKKKILSRIEDGNIWKYGLRK